MTQKNAAAGLYFPCSFPIKAVGFNTEMFEQAVRDIVDRHVSDGHVGYVFRQSGGGKYLSITATFTAASREQLDALYRDLNEHELVVMTL